MGCLLIEAVFSPEVVFLDQEQRCVQSDVCWLLYFSFCNRRSTFMERGAFAMCTSPLDVATVTISRLVCARVWEMFGRCRVWSAYFGVGVRERFQHNVVVSKSVTCTFVLRCIMRCQVVHGFLISVLLTERLVGRHTLKATLRTGASVSPGERVGCWRPLRVVLFTHPNYKHPRLTIKHSIAVWRRHVSVVYCTTVGQSCSRLGTGR